MPHIHTENSFTTITPTFFDLVAHPPADLLSAESFACKEQSFAE